MQSEPLTFSYKLTVINDIELAVKVNGETVLEPRLLNIGKHELTFDYNFELLQNYTLSLATAGAIIGPSAIIDNIELTWNDYDKVTPYWRLESDPREVWDYIDPDATRRAQAFENHPSLRTIALDYKVNDRLNGFLNNYGHFRHIDGAIDSLVDNSNRPYTIAKPGEFLFKFQSPVAYWLHQRLYFRIKPKDDYHTTS